MCSLESGILTSKMSASTEVRYMYEIHRLSLHVDNTCLAYNFIQLFLQQVETKFIKEPAYVPLGGQLPPCLKFPEVFFAPDGTSNENDENNIVEKIYRGSLLLKDYVTNILIALVVQMSFTRDKVTGSSKVCFRVLLVSVLLITCCIDVLDNYKNC